MKRLMYREQLAKLIRLACKAALDRKTVIVPRKAKNILLNSTHSSIYRFDVYDIVLSKAGYGEVNTEVIKKALQKEFCRLELIGKLHTLGTALLEVFPLICVRSVVDEGRQIRVYFIVSVQETVVSYLTHELLSEEENFYD